MSAEDNWPGLTIVHELPNRGRGVFATKTFAESEVVCHYGGELLDDVEGSKRYARETEHSGGFLFSFKYKGCTMWRDASDENLQGFGRLINHSRCHNNVSQSSLVALVSRFFTPITISPRPSSLIGSIRIYCYNRFTVVILE
jgi:hypothetical protein